MDGKAGEAAALLTGFAGRLAATLEARMALFEQPEAEPANVEKDAKAIAALGRAAIIIHAVKAAEDKSAHDDALGPSARPPSAHNDNHGEGDEMEPDERAHTGRSEEDLATLRAEVERRFERLARSFDRKGVQPGGDGADDSLDAGLLARTGQPGPDPALE